MRFNPEGFREDIHGIYSHIKRDISQPHNLSGRNLKGRATLEISLRKVTLNFRLKITVKNLQKRIPIDLKKIKKAVLGVLSQEHVKKSGEITVCFVRDAEIRKLNLEYLGKNNPTDVIAFDISERNRESKQNIMADIVVSADRAVANAAIFNTTPLYELCLYVVHGVLHLLGYDDKTARQKNIMDVKASRILSKVGY